MNKATRAPPPHRTAPHCEGTIFGRSHQSNHELSPEDRRAPADVVSYTALITAYGRGAQWRRALETFARMQRARCAPDHVIFEAVIEVLWETGAGAAGGCGGREEVFVCVCVCAHAARAVPARLLHFSRL